MHDGDVHRVGLDASNQKAEKIVNVGLNQGDINVTNIYHQKSENKVDIKPANKFLCRQLIEALQEFSPRAKSFLKKDIAFLEDAEMETWEHLDNYLPKAKGIIIGSYPSIIGVFLSNLFGSEKQKDYFDVGLAMTKRTIQLLCFAFISRFWDLSKDKEYELKPEQLKQFRKFFYAGVEPGITFYAEFFKTLLTLFHENGLEYPIPETMSMEADFSGNNDFLNTCKSLDGYRAQFGKDHTLPPMDEFERTITSFLVSVRFLANYKMVSVKNIGYEAIRNRTAQFVHAYSMLGVNNATVNNGVKYLFQEKAINTDAVLLFKDKYLDGLNLFPFVIDINALKDQDLARVYFYACNDEDLKTITYFDTYKTSSDDKNAPDEVIEFNKDFEEVEQDIININKSEERDIEVLKRDAGRKYTTFKMYELYKTFQLSKSSFFGNEDS